MDDAPLPDGGPPPGTGIPPSLKPVLARIAAGATLDEAQAQAAFELVISGHATPAQIGALLMGLRVRGETVAELAGAVRAMRAQMIPVPGVADAIDLCGTGGDGHATLNISTAVAFVLAALGVPVAKHGNRAMSSRAGAVDTLEALGLVPEADPQALEASLQVNRLAFLAASLHHPGMRHAAPARAELGTRTIFNLLGPLCNPAGVRRQMIGVFDPRWQEPVARTLRLLGSDCVWVVHGEDAIGGAPLGLDEFSLAGPTRVVALQEGRLGRFSVGPQELGLSPRPISAIAGGTPAENAAALRRLLGGETGPYRDTVRLNAAAALQVSGRGSMSRPELRDGPLADSDELQEVPAPLDRLRDGLSHAARVLDDGSALAVLDAMRRASWDATRRASRDAGERSGGNGRV